MTAIRAVVVDPNTPGRLAIASVDAPAPAANEALVRVAAVSLNLGEIRRVSAAEAGWRPGWDLAGTVERAAADGSGPPSGARVVGFLPAGAWAELVSVPTTSLAVLPDAVSFAQASTLPVAGLTALRALELGGLLLDRTVLVTGASGGVGHFACRLARNAGARVVGSVRRPEREAAAREAGAHEVVVGEDLSPAREFGPYHLILESVGGQSMAAGLGMLARNGICVLYGASAGPEVTLDARSFYLIGGASIYGFILFYEAERNPVAEDLGRLVDMVADGRLHPQIDVEAPWTEIGAMTERLSGRQIAGKAVLHLS